VITVLMATYNGSKTLAPVLKAYGEMAAPRGGWKLVIVDNGSTDDTRAVVTGFMASLPITLLSEPRKGKNAALNTGLRHIEGDLVVFTDDDVLPDKGWLAELRSAADEHPLYFIFGGPVFPHWERPPDEWILSWVPLPPTYAISDDQDEGPVDNHTVYGPNMAVRSSIFQNGYKFNEEIGPNRKKYAQGSETELLMRLGRAGFKAWHCRKATVRHMIRSHQMEKDWVLKRAIRFGRGQYRLGWEYAGCRSTVFGLPKPIYLRLLRSIYHVLKAVLRGDAEKLFIGRWRLNYLIGVGIEARNLLKDQPR
jgi:glycosyltransferase involved in cell wall biosynthesis